MFGTWSLAIILTLERYGVGPFLGPHLFFKPAKVNLQLNQGPEAVELHLHTKPSSKGSGEYAKFTPEQQANIARYA